MKRCHLDRLAGVGKGWTRRFLAWLRGLAGGDSPLAHGTRLALISLLEQHAFLEAQETEFDHRLQELALTRRYVKAF